MVSAAGMIASDAGHQAAQPGPHADVEEAFHDDLAARVPVRVEDCPEQSSATANITPATLMPSSGNSNTWPAGSR